MELVINLPEEMWAIVKVGYVPLGISKCLMNGIPLPKGHGALKDVDNIKTAFPSGEYVRTESVIATIDHEETIIETDISTSTRQKVGGKHE